MKLSRIAAALLLLATLVPSLQAQTSQETAVQELKAQLDALKADYEQRIKNLEDQIQQLQIQMLQAPGAEEAAPAAPQQAAVQTIPGALNPAISVVSNFVGRVDNQNVYNDAGDLVNDKMNLREAELDFRVPVDPYADGVLIASIESEVPGQFSTGVEEGYVNLKKLPFWESEPLGLKIKVGRFRPAFGKINILHTHDLPTTFRPLVIQEFLGEEGFIQQGVSTNFFIPTPWDENSSLDATFEFMDGGDVALSPQPAARASYLGHIRWFRNFGDANTLELGWSTYGHPSSDKVGAALANDFDFFYRWKPLRQGEWKSLLLGGEYLSAPKVTAGEEAVKQAQTGSSATPQGFYVLGQWQLNRRIYAGLRYDNTDVLLQPDLKREGVTPYLSYYFSEFLRFRVNYEHLWSDIESENGRNSVFFELNWVFGAHPPEPFWVNK